MIIAYNWPKGSDRHRRIAQFVDKFFTKFNEFQKPPRHPKWREVNLAAQVPGLAPLRCRRGMAREKSRATATASARSKTSTASSRQARRANAAQMTAADRERLFQEFVKWSQAQPSMKGVLTDNLRFCALRIDHTVEWETSHECSSPT